MSFRWDDVWRCSGSWAPLNNEFHAGYMAKLGTFLSSQLAARREFYPPTAEIFTAFELTALDKVKVAILGQDPYADGKATGLAFTVRTEFWHPTAFVLGTGVVGDGSLSRPDRIPA